MSNANDKIRDEITTRFPRISQTLADYFADEIEIAHNRRASALLENVALRETIKKYNNVHIHQGTIDTPSRARNAAEMMFKAVREMRDWCEDDHQGWDNSRAIELMSAVNQALEDLEKAVGL